MKPIIKIENLSKQYRLGTIGTGTISHDLNRWWWKIRGKGDPTLKIGETNKREEKGLSEYVWALRDINMEVMPGEVVGIIGKNGAGKSTLLKILSKVTGPTTGSIQYNGRIGSLLEVGTGFHPELTGRENIFLNGAILGMTKQEIRSKLDEIVDFSGCERYIDTPVKRYSSGMKVRLGFAVAAHLEPEILVVDEVLAVGDAEFQKKAIGKMQDVSKNDGRTVLFVSHNMDSMLNLCNRGILIENGSIGYSSDIEDTVNYYLASGGVVGNYHCEENSKPLYISSVDFIGTSDNVNGIFRFDESIGLKIVIQKHDLFEVTEKHIVSVGMYLQNGIKVCSFEYGLSEIKDRNTIVINALIPKKILAPNKYKFAVGVHIPNVEMLDLVNDICYCTILDNGTEYLKYNKQKNGVVIIEPSFTTEIQ